MVMVGDGVNDVLVLVIVDIGIVIGLGFDVVKEMGGIIFVCSDVCDVVIGI